MNFYRFTLSRGSEPTYFPDLQSVHFHARTWRALPEVLIELIDVPLDKPNVLRLLNAGIDAMSLPAVKAWSITPRGGLKQLSQAEVDELNSKES